MKKIIILNTREIYGGTIVLSLLCKLLCKHGYDAKVLYVHAFPNLQNKKWRFWIKWAYYSFIYRLKKILFWIFKGTVLKTLPLFSCFEYIPIKNVPEKYTPFYNKNNVIVVYPEVVSGNILNAKHVVRWLLFNHKWEDLSNAISPSDLIICYRTIFNDWALNPEGYELKLNYFNSELYRQYNFEERKGNCYIIRKGRNRIDLPNYFDGPIIDYGMSESEIVRILNRCKYCYSYDTQTYYTTIASVCGCIPIVMLEKGKTKADYLGENESHKKGIAYGDASDEIRWAISSRQDLLDSLDYTSINDYNIKKFIGIIQKKFS